MARALIKAIEFFLPSRTLTNEQLAAQFPEWGVAKIAEKTGIAVRHIAGPNECSSDLAYSAAMKLFSSGAVRPEEIDFVLFCTQTPDFLLPTSACVLQHRLGIPTMAGALDFNLGCSGFVYGLSLCKGLIESGQARSILLLTAETYSKLLASEDKTVRTIFGDGGAATLVQASDSSDAHGGVGHFVFGTDGAGARNLMCVRGGTRSPCEGDPVDLAMNGPEIFNFTIMAVPTAVNELLARDGLHLEDVDLFVFHQANSYMLEHLRRKIGIPRERFLVAIEQTGNTVSATIPIALRLATGSGKLRPGMRVMLVGFGVGYSWAACLMRWT